MTILIEIQKKPVNQAERIGAYVERASKRDTD